MSQLDDTPEFAEIRASVRELKERAAVLLQAAAELEMASVKLRARMKQASGNAKGSRAPRANPATRPARGTRSIRYRNE
jgi:hypothetical protein